MNNVNTPVPVRWRPYVRPVKIRIVLPCLLLPLLLGSLTAPEQRSGNPSDDEVRLITLDPGHFHAALLQKEMLPGVSKHVAVYAPLGPDLIAHLSRIGQFNARKESPTNWDLEIYAGPDFFERMLEQRRGNVVVLSGRNQGKIARICSCINAGFHVLADKPWILESTDLPKLEAALNTAEGRGTVAFDIMTERFEITYILQRDLVNDVGVFGAIVPGNEQAPGVSMESVHHLMKNVAGVPLTRPPWFFDISQQGEGLTDIGTHLADLVQWSLFPEHAIDYHHDIHFIAAKRWPTLITKAEFQRVTGEADFPITLMPHVRNGRLEYYCNNLVSYTLRGVHARLNILWNYEAPPGGGDTYRSVFRGSRSRVEVRQGPEQNYRSEVVVIPNSVSLKTEVLAALKRKVGAIQDKFPGMAMEDRGQELMIRIPERYRVGHEAHFKQVVAEYLRFLAKPQSLPSWEKPNMLSKYYVTTKGVELARRNSAGQNAP
jgi:predicted dehydrogenase